MISLFPAPLSQLPPSSQPPATVRLLGDPGWLGLGGCSRLGCRGEAVPSGLLFLPYPGQPERALAPG